MTVGMTASMTPVSHKDWVIGNLNCVFQILVPAYHIDITSLRYLR